jgi:hypothetical protein
MDVSDLLQRTRLRPFECVRDHARGRSLVAEGLGVRWIPGPFTSTPTSQGHPRAVGSERLTGCEGFEDRAGLIVAVAQENAGACEPDGFIVIVEQDCEGISPGVAPCPKLFPALKVAIHESVARSDPALKVMGPCRDYPVSERCYECGSGEIGQMDRRRFVLGGHSCNRVVPIFASRVRRGRTPSCRSRGLKLQPDPAEVAGFRIHFPYPKIELSTRAPQPVELGI